MDIMEHEQSAAKTWVVIVFLLLIVSFQGGLAYLLIGDLGQPDWDYRPVRDVPGESPYAMYEYLPFPQHVKGDQADYPPLDENAWIPELNRNWDKSFFPTPQQNAMGE